jgi:hypothetical protein
LAARKLSESVSGQELSNQDSKRKAIDVTRFV